jgi:hypothetical protein
MILSRGEFTEISKIVDAFPDTSIFELCNREVIGDSGFNYEVLDVEIMHMVNGFLASVKFEINV